MTEERPMVSPNPPWLFVSLVFGFAAYYAHDVWGGRFETIAYGFLCISLLGVLGLAFVISTIRQRRLSGGHAQGLSKTLRPFLLLSLLTAYAAFQAALGFLAATFLAFGCLVWFFGEQRWPYLLAIAIGMAFLTYLIFVELLSIPVPAGAIFD
ncbi:MAG: tripartite tricarboxylate transporter TctB family protein [Geminicoccaceae bacterium]